MRLRLGTPAELCSGEHRSSPFVRKFSNGILTHDVTGVYSDGFDPDQDFVLFQFWDGNFLEDYVFTLALWLSILQGSEYLLGETITNLLDEGFAGGRDGCHNRCNSLEWSLSNPCRTLDLVTND